MGMRGGRRGPYDESGSRPRPSGHWHTAEAVAYPLELRGPHGYPLGAVPTEAGVFAIRTPSCTAYRVESQGEIG